MLVYGLYGLGGERQGEAGRGMGRLWAGQGVPKQPGGAARPAAKTESPWPERLTGSASSSCRLLVMGGSSRCCWGGAGAAAAAPPLAAGSLHTLSSTCANLGSMGCPWCRTTPPASAAGHAAGWQSDVVGIGMHFPGTWAARNIRQQGGEQLAGSGAAARGRYGRCRPMMKPCGMPATCAAPMSACAACPVASTATR